MAELDRPKVFFDADILIAGSFSTTGASNVLLRLGEAHVIEALTSRQALEEAERNLEAKLPQGLALFKTLVAEACEVVEDPSAPALKKYEREAHPQDLPILAAAISAGCEALVTFNTKDFRPRSGRIRIETPAKALNRIRGRLKDLAEQDSKRTMARSKSFGVNVATAPTSPDRSP